MNYVFTAQGLFVDLVPSYIRLLWCDVPDSLRIPCIEVAFDIPSLLRASSVFHAMKVRRQKPEVFIWDETLHSPEFMLVFSLYEPNAQIMAAILGRPAYATVFEKAEVPKIVTFSSANLAKEGLSDFFRYFDQGQRCLLVITESTDKDVGGDGLLSAAIDTVDLTSLRREKIDIASMME